MAYAWALAVSVEADERWFHLRDDEDQQLSCMYIFLSLFLLHNLYVVCDPTPPPDEDQQLSC